MDKDIDAQIKVQQEIIDAARKRIDALMGSRKIAEPGWVVATAAYGKWFVPYAAVANDLSKDREQYCGVKDPSPPSKESVESWFSEQISGIETFAYGTQLALPKALLSAEAAHLDRLKNDPDPIVCNAQSVRYARKGL